MVAMIIEMMTTYPSVSYLSNLPELVCTTIKPAIMEATPPDICCVDELMLIKAPLSFASGTAVNKAEEEIILAESPINKITFSKISCHTGVMPKWVYMPTINKAITVPAMKILNFPILSLNLPNMGPNKIEEAPVMR